MTDEKKPADPRPVTDDKDASVHRITRRRFTKAGAVAPVIITLASRPVWGQTCSPSAVGSLTHVSHNRDFDIDLCKVSCAPGDWEGRPDLWKGGYNNATPMSVFGFPADSDCTGEPDARKDLAALGASTFGIVIGLGSIVRQDQKEVTAAVRQAARETIAALLNAAYRDYLNSGRLEPYPFYPLHLTDAAIKNSFGQAMKDYCGSGSTASFAGLSFPSNGLCFLKTIL